MKTRLSLIISVVCCLPLLFNIPYIITAWGSSPLDAFDIIFVPMAAFVLTMSVVRTLRQDIAHYRNKRSLFLLFPTILLLLAAAVMRVHALLIFFSIVFWWTTIWFLMGWEIAWRLLPGFGILSLITVSSTYWICYFSGCDTTSVRGFKVAVAGALAALAYSSVEHGFRPRVRTVFAIALALIATFVCLEYKAHTTCYRPFSPEIDPLGTPGYIGREVKKGDLAEGFFRTSDAHYFRFANEKSQISALQVNVGENIHEIHPAALCLRSAGWRILSEKPTEVTIGDKTIQVSEIDAINGAVHMLVWVWYSSDYYSTGSFIAFRRHTGLRKGTNWRTYQIAVPMLSDLDETRAQLTDFLSLQQQWLGGELH